MFGRVNLLTAACLLCFILPTLYFPVTVYSQDEVSNEKIIERYKLMLSRKPKEGSTFDRLYQFYLEGAGLDAMVADYQAEAQANPNDANIQLILGHIYKRLGKDTEATAAYQRAVELAPDNYYPHFALGVMHGTLRQHEKAIQALTKAASLSEQAQDVPPEELTAIYKALGNAYFRRDRVDEAIQAWQKISELDPQDIFARIELADLFREQELYEQAIAQHEAIIILKKDDPYRICLSHREIGNIHESKGDYHNAIQSYDAALALTAPGNWLRKDLQHRIIGIFAADSNWKGLIEYYQGKLETTSNEPELLGLLGAAYIENQQLEEGISTYQKGIELAPTDVNLRLNLIAALRNAEKFVEAAAEYEVLSEQDPDNFGIYRELGELYLQIENEDKARATYQQMIDRDPNNASTYLTLAEIYTGHEWIDDAITQYEKAISLAPNNLDYIEYFGEFYFRQGNREKALETWNRMVANDKATAVNNDRLAQLLNAKDFKAEAVAAIRKAVALMPNEYRYHETLAKHLAQNKEYDEAIAEYTAAMKLAPNEFFAEKMDAQRIELYRRQGTLGDQIEALERELENSEIFTDDVFAQQKRLTRMYLKFGNMTYALEVLLKAKSQKPDDVAVNRWLAEIYNKQGRRDEANAIYTHLIEVDRANAREYHANIAQSYLNVMDFDAAIAAARSVIAHSPRNPEGHQMLAEIAKQTKEYQTAIDSLKQAIRLRPDAIDIRAELAAVYRLSEKPRQALAQYWRCWDLSSTVSEKLAFVKPLSEAYYDLGRRGEFEEKLKQLSKSNTSGVAPILALAELYRMDGDLPNARFQLAKALDKDRKNPDLLSKLVQVSLDLGDNQDALAYQQRLVKAHPDTFHQQKLGELLFDAGREQEAIQAWTKLLHAKNQTLEAEVKLANLLIRHGLIDEAAFVLDRAAEKITGTDAHIALYQLGAVFVRINDFERARTYFQQILDMPKPTENAAQDVKGKTTYVSYGPPGIDIYKFGLADDLVYQIQDQSYRQRSGQSWMPKSFEEAQAGALAHLVTIVQQQGELNQLIRQFEEAADANPKNIQTLETLAQLYTLTDNTEKIGKITDRLITASPNDATYQAIRLNQALEQNLDVKTIEKHLNEIIGLPKEARLWYKAQFASTLYDEGKKSEAEDLLSQLKDEKVLALNTAEALVDAFILIGKIDIAERITTDLPIPPKSRMWQYRGIYNSLINAYLNDGKIDKAIHLFWSCCERTQPNTTNPKRVASLSYSSFSYSGYNRIQSEYPSDTKYYSQGRLSFLQGFFTELLMKGQQEQLYTKLKAALDNAEGINRIYPGLALSYCYWWERKQDESQEIHARLQKEFPNDLTLKLSTVFVSIQTGQHVEALNLLEELVASDPKNRRQYYDLTLQLVLHTGNTVTVRELMNKLLNSPSSVQELYEISQRLQEAGLTQYATAVAKKAVTMAMGTTNPNFLIDLSEHLEALGRGQDAALLAERALRFANRPDRYGRTLYAWNFRQAANFVGISKIMQEREPLLVEAVQKNPKSSQAQLKLAMFYEATNQIDKAAEAYKTALGLRPKDSLTRNRYVQMLQRNGKAKDAVSQYTILLRENPNVFGFSTYDVVRTFFDAGKIDELVALAKEMVTPSVGRNYGYDFAYRAARECMDKNNSQAAAELYEKLIEVHPSRSHLYEYLADAYDAAGEREKAIQFLRDYISAAEDTESVIDETQKLAEFYKASDRIEELVKEYEAKLTEKPKDSSLLYLVASMKIIANDLEGADTNVSQMLEQDIESINVRWLNNLADAFRTAGDADRELKLLEKIVETFQTQHKSGLSDTYRKLGAAYALQNETEKAQDAFRKMGNLQIMFERMYVWEKERLADTFMQHEMWNDAEVLYTEIANDLTASSWNREDAQEQLMEIYKQRGDLGTADQLAEKTQKMNIGMQRLIAKEFAGSNELSKAVQIYEHITSLVPEDFESRAQLATLYSRLNQHDKATNTWKTLLEIDPENSNYQDGLVNSYETIDRIDKAIELALHYIQNEPESSVHHVRLAKLYVNEARFDDAISAYKDALEIVPGNRHIWQDLAGLYLHTGDVDAAEQAFKEAIQYTARDYDRRNIERKLIGLYRQIGKFEEMLRKAENENALTPELQQTLAQHLRDTGELQQAADMYHKTLDMTQDKYDRNRTSNELIGVYVKLGNTDEALKIYETNINFPPFRSISYISSGIKLNYNYERTRDALIDAYKEQSQQQQLTTLFEEKREKEPENSAVLEMLATLYNDAKDFKKAADTYIAVSKADPTNIHSYFQAAILKQKMGQIELAKELIKQGENALASSNNKSDRWFLAELATICVENKMYAPAIRLANSALAASINYSHSSFHEAIYKILGKSYSAEKQYEEAFNTYKQMENVVTWSNAKDEARSGMRKAAKDGKLYEKWIPQQLRRVEENPDDTDALSTLAQSYESTNQIKEAIAQYEKLNELQPDNLQWYKKLGELYQNLPTESRETGEVIEGTALTLGGDGSFVEIGDSESLDNIREQVTVSAWIKPTRYPSRYVRIILRSDEKKQNYRQRSYILVIRSDGKLKISSSPQDGGYASLYSSPGLIKLNTWTHIAGVINGKKDYMKVFVNGHEVGHRHYNGKDSFVKCRLPLRIGTTHRKDEEKSSFVGQIDEVRVWNVARTEHQIRSDMNTELNGNEPGLVGYWKFDEETEGVVSDATANENDGKLIGNAKLESYTRPILEIPKPDDLDMTVAIYEKAIEHQPTASEFYNLLAQIYREKGDTPQIEAVYREALNAPLTQQQHESAINAIGQLYTDEDQKEKWVAILEKMKPKLEESAVFQELLGNAYKKTGDVEKSELAFSNWLKIRKRELNRQQNSWYYRDFADQLLKKDLFPETALNLAKRASLGTTGSLDYILTLGTAYIANGNYDDALEQFKMCVNIISSEPEAERFWKRLADSHKKAKDKNLHAEMIDKLINSISAQNTDNRINTMRGIAEFYSLNDMFEDAEMYVRKTGLIPETAWIKLGPFDSPEHVGYVKSYIPEAATYIDTTAKYYGKDKLVQWEKLTDTNVNGLVYLGNNEWTAAYAWAIVISPDERDIAIRFDSDDQGTVWLNGKQVFTHDRNSAVALDRYSFPVTLKQGENTIFLKVCNGTGSTEFYMRLTDAEGNPIEDLKYKTADALLKAEPGDPIFHVTSILGMVEYHSENDDLDKAKALIQQTGTIPENAWLMLGPLDNTAGIGYNTVYIQENATQIDKTANYEGVDGKVSWKTFTDDAYNGFIDFGKNVNWCVSYAWATVNCPDEREVQLRFDSDDQSKIWLNGKEIFTNTQAQAAIVDRYTIPVKFKAGKNTLLVKVCNEEARWGFYLRITDVDGKPFEDLHIGDAQVD